jgi:hypothetical protein
MANGQGVVYGGANTTPFPNRLERFNRMKSISKVFGAEHTSNDGVTLRRCKTVAR